MCLAIPGKIVEIVPGGYRLGHRRSGRRAPPRGTGPARRRSARAGRLGADPRRLRDEQDQRAGGHRSDAHAERCSAKMRPRWRRCAATGSKMTTALRRARHEVRRRISRAATDPEGWPPKSAGWRDPGAPLSADGSLRRTHARDLSLRPQGPAAGEHRADSRARLPGVRAADGAHRRRAVDGRSRATSSSTAFGDMMRVPGTHGSPLEHKAAGMDVRIVYSPLDALKLARDQPGQACDVLRHRLRDHGAVDGADADAGEGAGNAQLFGVLQSRHDHPGHPRDSRFARHAARRLHRAGPRVHRHRLPARTSGLPATKASRSSCPASSRSISCRAS